MGKHEARISAAFFVILLQLLIACKASPPTRVEKKVIQEGKDLVIGGKDWRNPLAGDAGSTQRGAENFRQHCAVCHGLDGDTTGVRFAGKMSPPGPRRSRYSEVHGRAAQMDHREWDPDERNARWKGLVADNDMWQIVCYIRRLPSKRGAGVAGLFAPESLGVRIER